MSLKALIPEAEQLISVELTYEEWLHIMNNLQARAVHWGSPDDKVGRRSNSSYSRYLMEVVSKIGDVCKEAIFP